MRIRLRGDPDVDSPRWVPIVPEVCPIAELPEAGLVALRGRVVAEAPVRSWADGAPLVAELLRLHLSARDAEEEGAAALVEQLAASDFVVEDPSGGVPVRRAGGRVVLQREPTTIALSSLPAALEARLPGARGLFQQDFTGYLASHLLRPGDPVLVTGEVGLEQADGFRGGFRRVIRAPSTRDHELELLIVGAALEKRLRKGRVPPGLSCKLPPP